MFIVILRGLALSDIQIHFLGQLLSLCKLTLVISHIIFAACVFFVSIPNWSIFRRSYELTDRLSILEWFDDRTRNGFVGEKLLSSCK